MNAIDLDQYLNLKKKHDLKVFIFLLNDEYPYLDSDTSWIHYLKHSAYPVRMSEDEFHMMDFGKHPKVVLTRGDRELAEINGLPSIESLKKQIASVI